MVTSSQGYTLLQVFYVILFLCFLNQDRWLFFNNSLLSTYYIRKCAKHNCPASYYHALQFRGRQTDTLEGWLLQVDM